MSYEKNFKQFVVLWSGQFLALLGSGLSSFGLSVWIFESTGSATPFAMSILSSLLPSLIFAPFAGSFADRMNRKHIIVITTFLDLSLKLIMAILLYMEALNVGLIYPIVFLSATFHAFQGPALHASIPSLVPHESLSRANGLMQFSNSSQSMLAPIFAGALYPFLGLTGLLGINFVTFVVAILIYLTLKIPQPSVEESKKSMFNTAFSDFRYSWNYLQKKNGLLSLILSLALLNFVANIAMVLLGPLLLSNYDTRIFGTVEAIFGSAMVIGGLVAGIIPNIDKKVRTMFLCIVLSSLGLSFAGISASWVLIAIGFFIFMLPVPYVNSLLQSTIHVKVEPGALGRVGALLNALLKVISPIAVIASGPLADKIFEPIMGTSGPLGRSMIGNLIGAGPGRGIGLMFILSGLSLGVLCLGMLSNRTIMTLETRLPNYVTKEKQASADCKEAIQVST